MRIEIENTITPYPEFQDTLQMFDELNKVIILLRGGQPPKSSRWLFIYIEGEHIAVHQKKEDGTILKERLLIAYNH